MSTVQTSGVRCARCHRVLKNPKYIGNVPFGVICIKKVMAARNVSDVTEQVEPAPHNIDEVRSESEPFTSLREEAEA